MVRRENECLASCCRVCSCRPASIRTSVVYKPAALPPHPSHNIYRAYGISKRSGLITLPTVGRGEYELARSADNPGCMQRHPAITRSSRPQDGLGYWHRESHASSHVSPFPPTDSTPGFEGQSPVAVAAPCVSQYVHRIRDHHGRITPSWSDRAGG